MCFGHDNPDTAKLSSKMHVVLMLDDSEFSSARRTTIISPKSMLSRPHFGIPREANRASCANAEGLTQSFSRANTNVCVGDVLTRRASAATTGVAEAATRRGRAQFAGETMC